MVWVCNTQRRSCRAMWTASCRRDLEPDPKAYIDPRRLIRLTPGIAPPDRKPALRATNELPGRVEWGCGAVAVGRACLLPPLSSGGALVARPWLRFHTPSRPGEFHPEPLSRVGPRR